MQPDYFRGPERNPKILARKDKMAQACAFSHVCGFPLLISSRLAGVDMPIRPDKLAGSA